MVVRGDRLQVLVRSKPKPPVRLVVCMVYLLLSDAQMMDPRTDTVARGADFEVGETKQSVQHSEVEPANHAVWASTLGAVPGDQVEVVIHGPSQVHRQRFARDDLADPDWPHMLLDGVFVGGPWKLWPVIPQPSAEFCTLLLSDTQLSQSPVLVGPECKYCLVPHGQSIPSGGGGSKSDEHVAVTGYWYPQGSWGDSSILMQRHVGFSEMIASGGSVSSGLNLFQLRFGSIIT